MYFGADYNPEQWPEHVWKEDIQLMHEASVNLVSVGIFSWARLEPEEGVFDFGWMDRLLDALHDGGIAVDLATGTASPPPWAVHRYPDIVPVTAEGVPLGVGSRQHYAPTSPDYRRLAGNLARAVGERYATHPAVRMWHVNNEYACHVRSDFSTHAEKSFREWLRARYGSIEALNAAWGTTFWSQHYAQFDEVQPPRAAPTTQNPCAVLDFRRFTSDSILELFVMERDILREAGVQQPITTNFMGPFPALDYWKWAAEVDFVSDDNYPDPRDPAAFRQAAFARDLMRSLKPGHPWLLMEQAPNAVQWRPNNAPKAPGQMAAWSEQAIARGSDGVMYFQWRQSRAGQEKFHSAMVPQSGTRSRTWQEIRRLGNDLAERRADTPDPGEVAIMWDWENAWALDQVDLPADINYTEQVFIWYQALHRAHIQCSFVKPTSELSGFKVIIAPTLYLLAETGAENLKSFVESGGTLVTTAFTDIVNEHDHFREGGYGVQLGDVLGGQPIDIYGVESADGLHLTTNDGDTVEPQVMVETFELVSGTAEWALSDGTAGMVVNSYGAGTSVHLTTLADERIASRTIQRVICDAQVRPVLAGLPEVVEAIATADGVVLINHSITNTSISDSIEAAAPLAPFEARRL